MTTNMTNIRLVRDLKVLHATKFCVACAITFVLSVGSSIDAQTVANRVSQQSEPFIDTSEWVQSTSPFGDAYDRNYITETIVRGYRGPDANQSISPTYRDSAIEFSNEEKIQPIIYSDSKSPSSSPRRFASTAVQDPQNEMLRPIPDPLVNAANQITSPTGQAGQTQVGNSGSSLSTLRGYASQATFNQPVYTQPTYNAPVYNPSAYNQQPSGQPIGQSQIGAAGNAGAQTYAPQNYFTSNVSTANPYPYQANTPTNGYAGNYQQAQYYSQPNIQSQQPFYTSTLQPCCDPVYQPTQFATPNVNPAPNRLQTYPQYNYPNYGFGANQPFSRSTWVPVIPLRSMPYGTYLGQGIIGQPVAYVDGEPVRNFVRYIFP